MVSTYINRMPIKSLLSAIFVLFSCILYAQQKFKVVSTDVGGWREMYSLINEKGDTIRRLDTSKYYMCFNDESYGYFAVFGMKNFKGWAAVDANENILFTVYNTSFGEPSPDALVENKIRIVDGNNRIGFANHKGQVIIKPQFEIATTFHKGKAIIGQACEKVSWDKHAKESDCHHYSIVCQKQGYINEQGTILKMGLFSFEQIMREIEWKASEE